MRVVVFAPYYPPAFRAGGPVKSVSELVRSPRNPAQTRVVSRNCDLGDDRALSPDGDRWRWTGDELLWSCGTGACQAARGIRHALLWRPEAIYVNSLFDPLLAVLPALLWRLSPAARGAFLIVAPRGQTGAEALKRSRRRKQLLLLMWRVLSRSRRVVWHAASSNEQHDIEAALRPRRIVVRANEVGPLLPVVAGPLPSDTLRAVFLGRIVPIKGLLPLLEFLRHSTVSMTLDVLGPEEDAEYAGRCHEAADALPSHVVVSFLGPIASTDVRGQLATYDVMLNPTRGESFGQAIGESLSVGTPVGLEDVTPWTRWILKTSGGFIVHEDWTACVARYAGRSDAGRLEDRRCARAAYETWWGEAQQSPHLFSKIGQVMRSDVTNGGRGSR